MQWISWARFFLVSKFKQQIHKKISELDQQLIFSLFFQLQGMTTENQNLPEMERLKQEEFDMGGEENMILEEMANKVATDHRHQSLVAL